MMETGSTIILNHVQSIYQSLYFVSSIIIYFIGSSVLANSNQALGARICLTILHFSRAAANIPKNLFNTSQEPNWVVITFFIQALP